MSKTSQVETADRFYSRFVEEAKKAGLSLDKISRGIHDDGAHVIQFKHPKCRFLAAFDVDSKDSGWHIVSKRGLRQMGDFDPINLEEVVQYIIGEINAPEELDNDITYHLNRLREIFEGDVFGFQHNTIHFEDDLWQEEYLLYLMIVRMLTRAKKQQEF